MDMDALAALRLLVAWGADEALADDPLDRLAPETAPQRPPTPVPIPVPTPELAAGAPQAAERARAAAASADSLAALRATITAFEGISLRDTATGPVLFDGDPDAPLLVVGPPPSADDDRAGRPMTGAPGAFFDAMLASIGLARDRLLLMPLIPWRPPGDRPPSPAELAVCLPFLHRLVALCRARAALLLGPLAVRILLGTGRRPPRGRFTAAQVPGRATPLPCLPMASPAQLRADAELRRGAWAELRLLRRHLSEHIT
jgi:uracil-DNA glycosylase